MRDSNNPALEPLGQALLAYWRGKKSAELIHEFKNGQKRSLPVSVFFRSPEEFLTTDKAIEYCRGKILVVGAGTGVHALELEKQGYPGELEFRLSYEKNVGPWMRWLHVDFSTLTSHALKYGWSAEKLIETEEGGFLARMRPNL